MSEEIRIVIIDDHHLFRDGLKSIFFTEKNIRVVGEAEEGNTGLEIIRDSQPDVVLLDIGIPGISGLEVCHQITVRHPDIKTIILTMYKTDDYITSAFSTGAMGYVLKQSAVDELTTAIRSVKSGKKYLSSELTEGVLNEYMSKKKEDRDKKSESELSNREKEIVRLIVQGWDTKKISHSLNISPATVKTHRAQIMGKLGIHKSIDLVKYALKTGLIELD